MNKKTITILIGTIAIIGVLVFVFTKDGKQNEITPVKVEAPIEEVPAKVEGVEKIEGWQTFRSEELGFEVQYPEGWFVKERSEQRVSFGPGWSRPGGGLWHVVVKNTDKTLEDETDNLISMSQGKYDTVNRNSIKDVKIDRYDGISFLIQTENSSYYRPYMKILFIKEEKVFWLIEDVGVASRDNPDKDNGETFKMFYESFRFIN